MSAHLREVLREDYGLEHRDEITDIQPAVETLASIGDPHQAFPSFHVAGTNGKGSTAMFIAAVLQQAGYDVGLYFGPPVNGYLQRFQVNGEPLDRERFFSMVDRIVDRAEPSLYELSTAVAFTFFAEEDVDVAVVETGIGGRYDATNVLESDVAVFTSVAKDHTDLLGETCDSIAREHAAILNEGAVGVANVDDSVMHVFEDAAAELEVPLHRAVPRVSLEQGDGMRLDAIFNDRRVRTSILADYQEENINTALTALEHSPFTYTEEDVVETLASFTFPGRMQQVGRKPLTVLDGAHNPAAIEKVCETLQRFDGPITAVFGVMDDKDWEEMIQRLEREVDRLLLTDVPKDRAADPEDLAAVCDADAVFTDPVEAFDAARRSAEEGMVFVTGSLYLCRAIVQSRDLEN